MHEIGLWVLLASPWLGAAVCASLSTPQRQRHAAWVSLLSMCLTALGLALVWNQGALHLGGDLLPIRMDALALPFTVNVVIVGLAAIGYAHGYLAHTQRTHLVHALLLAFVGSMIGTLLADGAVVFFVFWEGMLIASSLLLDGWGEGPNVRRVTLVYFVFTQAGSLLLLVGLLWIEAHGGSSSLTQAVGGLRAAGQRGQVTIAWLMIVGLAVKMAIVPLHGWLPDAHAVAPMPVTLLLAGAMLSMGAYGMIRLPLSLLPAGEFGVVQRPLMILALLSIVYGALLCLAQRDAKRFVAYSSVSQMGYVLYGLASGTLGGAEEALLLVISHGLLKTLLFMAVGAAAWRKGTRQISKLRGLAAEEPLLYGMLLLGALGIAGLPPLCGFWPEWLILAGGLQARMGIWSYAQFLGPLLTLIYAVTLVTRIGWGRPDGAAIAPSEAPELPVSIKWTMIGIAVLVIAFGLWPRLLLNVAESAVYESMLWVRP